MKTLQKFTIVVFLILFSSLAVTAQTEHYEYAEILVIEKLTNGKTDVKGIFLNSMSQEAGLDENEISKIESTAQLFWTMNQKGWFLFDRNSLQPGASAWSSIIFRKKK